jgi:Tfp pilus assembly protein PilF
MRSRAARLAAQAKLLPKDKVKLWIAGECREIMLMAYELHDEPIVKHSKRVESLLGEALMLLRQRGKEPWSKAEELLKKALVIEPEAPDLMNNLAVAFMQQGRVGEVNTLIRDIVARHPDYIFASAALARLHLESRDVEAAEALLKPFLSRDRFHILEFCEFMDAYIELMLAKQNEDVARSWLGMWENVSSQMQFSHPKLDYWKKRLGHKLQLPRLFG